MRYNDVRKPIEYVVDQYFNRKKLSLKNQEFSDELGLMQSPSQEVLDEELPRFPVHIIRDETTGKVSRIVYGDLDTVMADPDEHSCVIWQEELVRDVSGKVISIKTTYPDGEVFDGPITRDPVSGKVVKVE